MVSDPLKNVVIDNETDENLEEYLDKIKDVLKTGIIMEKAGEPFVNVIIVKNDYIHELNKKYRNIDRPTDVISFALEDEGNEEIPGVRVLGDIYISIDKAKEQAVLYDHSLKRELCFLAIHGLLHLLGYDHMEKEDEIKMFSRQEEILNENGCTRI